MKKIILIVFCVFFSVFIMSKFQLNLVNTGGNVYPDNWNVEKLLKKSYIGLNQSINYIYSTQGKIDYSSVENFTKQLLFTINVKETKYIKNSNTDSLEFSKYQLFKYKLGKVENKPIIVDLENKMYVIDKIEQNCKVIDLDNIENSSCLIIVDTNGYEKKPNNIKYQVGKVDKTDRYYFIVDGNKNKIVIPNLYKSIFSNAMK